MKIGTAILMICLMTNSFAQNNSFTPKYAVILDSSKSDRLLNQCSRATPKKNISEFWNPSQNDITKLEKQFLKVKKIKATACCIAKGIIKSLDNFAFQYIGVTIKNRKYIYINAFYTNNVDDFNTLYKDWKTEPIIICDGGDYYWGVLFDLDKLQFESLAMNGVI